MCRLNTVDNSAFFSKDKIEIRIYLQSVTLNTTVYLSSLPTFNFV